MARFTKSNAHASRQFNRVLTPQPTMRAEDDPFLRRAIDNMVFGPTSG
jgi:hypothetical protein